MNRNSCKGALHDLRYSKVKSYKKKKVMKGLNLLAAFLGGAAVGAACGVLFAPEKGEDTRKKVADALRKRGIKLSRKEVEELTDEIAADLEKA